MRRKDDVMSDLSEPFPALTRSEKKREAILEASTSVFLGQGYDVASMDGIASAADVSKRTVYSHFKSKEDLFAETMVRMCGTKRQQMEMKIDLTEPIEKVLNNMGVTFLDMVFNPESSSMLRILVGQTDKFPELGKTFLENGPDVITELLGLYLEEQVERKVIQVSDPVEAAGSFLASLFGVHFVTLLATGKKPPGLAKRKKMVSAAVERFLHGCCAN